MLAQFRCGILPLRIETGRYTGEQIQDRKCRLCDQSSVEDECHFVLHCQLYENQRRNSFDNYLFDEYIQNKPEEEKLYFLMSNFPRKLAKFIVKAFQERRRILFS